VSASEIFDITEFMRRSSLAITASPTTVNAIKNATTGVTGMPVWSYVWCNCYLHTASCGPNHFMCDVHARGYAEKRRKICMPISWRCNNVVDCLDASVSRRVSSSLSTDDFQDENNCTKNTSCAANDILCDNHSCVVSKYRLVLGPVVGDLICGQLQWH
jgi:hypothetical protein